MNHRIFPFALLAMLLFGASDGYSQHRLTVLVEGIANAEGHIEIGLFDQAAHFAKKGKQRAGKRVPAQKGSVQVVFENLPKGQYAVAVVHDRDNNQRLSFSIVGSPKEPYAFSRQAKGTFGPPDFADAAFDLSADLVHRIRL